MRRDSRSNLCADESNMNDLLTITEDGKKTIKNGKVNYHNNYKFFWKVGPNSVCYFLA